MKVRDVDLSIGDDLQVRAGGDLSAGGTWPALALRGEVRIADATYVPTVDVTGMLKSLVRRKDRGGGAPSRAAKRRPAGPGALSVSLDVAIVAPEALHLEGQMAEAELGGNLRLKGTLDDPVLLGNISSTRGTVNLLGSAFDLTRARIEFNSPTEIDPDLDIVGTTTKGDDEITARIAGRASRAQLLFSSSSGKSQADVLRELVGGSSSSSSGSTSMADAAARMALQGATSSLFGTLGTRTSLQIVPLPSTAEGEDFLFSVGKDLGGGLGVTYFKGQSGETSDAFELRWRLSSRARGRVRQNQDGSLSGGFRIRSEFH
jgi:translocation and assembly module TamB